MKKVSLIVSFVAGLKNLMMSPKFKLSVFTMLAFCSSVVRAQNNLIRDADLAKEFKTSDTLFRQPYIDVDEWRDKPVRHRYIHGGFTGTSSKFSFYFPQKEKYQGHFFQYITPFPDSENGSLGRIGEEDKIGFCLSHGAYFVETNEGGNFSFTDPAKSD